MVKPSEYTPRFHLYPSSFREFIRLRDGHLKRIQSLGLRRLHHGIAAPHRVTLTSWPIPSRAATQRFGIAVRLPHQRRHQLRLILPFAPTRQFRRSPRQTQLLQCRRHEPFRLRLVMRPCHTRRPHFPFSGSRHRPPDGLQNFLAETLLPQTPPAPQLPERLIRNRPLPILRPRFQITRIGPATPRVFGKPERPQHPPRFQPIRRLASRIGRETAPPPDFATASPSRLPPSPTAPD